jgi:hypothetical protein
VEETEHDEVEDEDDEDTDATDEDNGMERIEEEAHMIGVSNRRGSFINVLK